MKPTVAERFDARLDEIRELLTDSGVVLAYLFGSAARGSEREDSDLDVAVLLSSSVRRARYGEIQLGLTTELVGLTHTNDVDVVLLNDAPPLLAFNIVARGRLFLGEPLERVRFEVRAIQRYIDTRPLRAKLAERLGASGEEKRCE